MQKHEPESSGANPIPIIEDDEAIDEEDEPTQAYFSSYIALRKNIINTQHLFSGTATALTPAKPYITASSSRARCSDQPPSFS
jgi:hypothetical protein